MIKKILLGLLVIILIFLGYVSTREGKFRYEYSEVIHAPADKVFEMMSDFKKGSLWSPFERVDPTMKKTYLGTDGQVGSVLEFDGNKEAGSGKLEMLKLVPNEAVDIRLIMTKPFKADNLIEYRLKPEGDGTRFTWSLSGDGGFPNKLITLFIDCEKMVVDQFKKGIANLKPLVETKP